MSIAEVRFAARELMYQADELTSIRQQMDSRTMVTARSWQGLDAARFQSDWDRNRSGLTRAIDNLRSMSTELNRQANEQEHASAPDSSSTVSTSRVMPVSQPVLATRPLVSEPRVVASEPRVVQASEPVVISDRQVHAPETPQVHAPETPLVHAPETPLGRTQNILNPSTQVWRMSEPTIITQRMQASTILPIERAPMSLTDLISTTRWCVDLSSADQVRNWILAWQ